MDQIFGKFGNSPWFDLSFAQKQLEGFLKFSTDCLEEISVAGGKPYSVNFWTAQTPDYWTDLERASEGFHQLAQGWLDLWGMASSGEQQRLEQENEKLAKTVAAIEKTLAAQTKEKAGLKKKLTDLQKKFAAQKDKLADQKKELSGQTKMLKEQQNEIAKQRKIVAEQQKELTLQKEIVAGQQQKIDAQKKMSADLKSGTARPTVEG